MEQIAFADRVLLNKTDLVSSEEVLGLRKRIGSINAVAKIFECEYGVIDLSLILGVKGFDLGRVTAMDPNFLIETEHQVCISRW